MQVVSRFISQKVHVYSLGLGLPLPLPLHLPLQVVSPTVSPASPRQTSKKATRQTKNHAGKEARISNGKKQPCALLGLLHVSLPSLPCRPSLQRKDCRRCASVSARLAAACRAVPSWLSLQTRKDKKANVPERERLQKKIRKTSHARVCREKR